MTITMIIPGKPIAKRRPRFYRRGKFVGTYSDQVTEEGRWLLSARDQIKEKLSGAIFITILFGMPIPKSLSKKKHQKIINQPHTKKPDLDNLVKWVLDCLNGEAWEDDASIFKIKAGKFYMEDPITRIFITKKEDFLSHTNVVSTE